VEVFGWLLEFACAGEQSKETDRQTDTNNNNNQNKIKRKERNIQPGSKRV
jgi:hypothetical protein